MTDTQQGAVVAPWHLMVKKAKQAHLREEHKDYNFYAKANVDKLTERHDQRHAEEAEVTTAGTGRFVNRIPHTHGSTMPTEAEAKVLDEMRAGIELDKPLPPQERKLLESLVDNDFASLKVEMQSMAADAKRSRLAEVDREWADKQAQGADYIGQVKEAWETLRQELIAVKTRAQAAGIIVTTGLRDHYGSDPVTIEIVGQKEAVAAATKEIDGDLNRALLALERQRLGAQRIVSLSGVTPEATRVLDTVPDAKGLMIEAAQVRIAAQIEKG